MWTLTVHVSSSMDYTKVRLKKKPVTGRHVPSQYVNEKALTPERQACQLEYFWMEGVGE
jgi:hypothetical protein